MKRPISFFAILALGAAMLQAAPQLYDITLDNEEKYTQCKIAYESDSTIKFTGTNKKGKKVTKEVDTASVLIKKEVKAKEPKKEAKPATETPDTKVTETPAAPEPKAEETPDTPAEEATDTQDEQVAEQEEEKAPELLGASSKEKSYDVLKKKVTEVEKKKEGIKSPSRNFTSRYNSTYNTVEKSLQKIETACEEIDTMQAEYDALTSAPFNFEIVSDLDRHKYAAEGKAAYDAMLMDMNQKENARKIGGLDKFEALRESYQGIPEYPEAHQRYIKTLKSLDSKWEKAIGNIEKKRKKMSESKLADLEKKEQAEFDKLERQLEDEGEYIAQVWYNPRRSNLVMLKNCKRKVEEALRRNKNHKPLEHTGKVTELISAFWVSLDKVREYMLAGKYDEAKDELEGNEDYKKIIRLHKNLLPEEYKKPLRDQREALNKELKDRMNKRRNLQRTLDSKRSALMRLTETTETQITRLNELADDELAQQKEADAAEEKNAE